MSAALTAVAGGVLSGVQILGQLFGGYGTVTIGPAVLTRLELPASMPVGGSQMLATKKLPGGARQIDAMGEDPRDMKWSGIIYQVAGDTRVQLLNNICKSGQAVTLAFDTFSYTVLVSEFLADYKTVGPIKYEITCTVISDNSSPQGQTLTALASQVVADVSTGNVVGALSSVSAGVVSGPVTAAATAVGTPGAATVGSSLYNGAITAVNAASGAINSALGTVNTALGSVGTSLGAVGQAATAAAPVLDMIPQVGEAVQNAGDAANLQQAAAYFGRASVNLSNASA